MRMQGTHGAHAPHYRVCITCCQHSSCSWVQLAGGRRLVQALNSQAKPAVAKLTVLGVLLDCCCPEQAGSWGAGPAGRPLPSEQQQPSVCIPTKTAAAVGTDETAPHAAAHAALGSLWAWTALSSPQCLHCVATHLACWRCAADAWQMHRCGHGATAAAQPSGRGKHWVTMRLYHHDWGAGDVECVACQGGAEVGSGT